MEAAKEELTFKAYLERYILGPRDHREYLYRVGFRLRGKRV
jgi:hypothetical protein